VKEEAGRRHAEPPRAHPRLRHRFLAGDVEHPRPAPGERVERLQQQRRFADPGITSEEDQRPGDQPTAEHPVELLDAARAPGRHLGDLDLGRRQPARPPGADTPREVTTSSSTASSTRRRRSTAEPLGLDLPHSLHTERFSRRRPADLAMMRHLDRGSDIPFRSDPVTAPSDPLGPVGAALFFSRSGRAASADR
jgi:hypothetical protein